MHPAVAKASQIGRIAGDNDWKAKLSSEVVDHQRITTLVGTRNDEQFTAQWTNVKLSGAGYYIFDRHTKITHGRQLISKIEGWPDIIDLFTWFPNMNRPNLVRTYRKLPFDIYDDNDFIISNLLGCKIFWYGHLTKKYHTDVVLPKQNNKCRIVDIGHRKLFHFIGAQAGFRSVMIDELLKVA